MTQEISLYYREGASDKVYHAQVMRDGDGFVVNFQYGRRGSTLTVGTKTKSPVSADDAAKVFEKLVAEKKAKGYTEGESGTPYVGGDKADRVSGYQVQLLNAVEESELERLFNDDTYVCQEKFDGKRMLLRFDGLKTSAINRKGLICGAPETVLQSLEAAANGCGGRELVIDGECIGDTFHAFDCLVFDGEDIRGQGYIERYSLLSDLGFTDGDWIDVATTVTAQTKQRLLFSALRNNRKEGVVFKHKDAPYTPGRPSSGGTQFKFKFQAEATCVVLKHHPSKRSFEVGVRDAEGEPMFVGNVTVPANKDFPEVGQLVEIRYLYAFPNGSLYQPFFKGVRDDKTAPDAYSTLKFKGEYY